MAATKTPRKRDQDLRMEDADETDDHDEGSPTPSDPDDDVFWDARCVSSNDALVAGFSSLFWVGGINTKACPSGKPEIKHKKSTNNNNDDANWNRLVENPLNSTTTPMKRNHNHTTPTSNNNNHHHHSGFQALLHISDFNVGDDDDSGILFTGEQKEEENAQGKEKIGDQQTSDECKSCCSQASSMDEHDNSAIDESFWAQAMFEIKYSSMGMMSLLCYCLAHLSIYELINLACVELSDTVFFNYGELFYALTLATALILLRLTGYIWGFMGNRRSEARRQHHRKRLQRGCWDARLTQWFKEHETAKCLVEITAFYMAYLAMNNFWFKFLLCAVDQRESIQPQLPSVRHRLTLKMNSEECSISDSSDEDAVDVVDWAERDDSYLYKNLAKVSYYHYSGADEQAALFSLPTAIMTYTLGLSLSILGLSKFGFTFVEDW